MSSKHTGATVKRRITRSVIRPTPLGLGNRQRKRAPLQNAALDAERAKLRAEVDAAKVVNKVIPDSHDYNEAQTRDLFIDQLLHEAGWTLANEQDREFEVSGMPNQQGVGFVDYVLWGDDGKPLALVEAKRTSRDAQEGQQQARLYADCLEQRYGQRPLIYYSNGYEHWLWDDAMYPPRLVQGFHKKDELALLVQRRGSRKPLGEATIDPTIVERHYQQRAIRRIGETFERDRQRKALVVMATGAGKTRTVIALSDLLMRCNWAKRILFLADRVALVNQAAGAFKKFLPDAAPVNLVTEKHTEGRVYVCTYPTMMGLINERQEGPKRFGIGHFDLIVIDEAHRSVYQKYRAIFSYFDALLVGLTATPKDEIDRNTYSLFNLESGETAIPAIAEQVVLIEAVAGEEWWQDVTVSMLEQARRKLRALIKLLEKRKGTVVYSNFEDELGDIDEVLMPSMTNPASFERFREKARAFLRAHEDHLSLRKLRRNQPLTAMDLEALEQMLLESGGGAGDIHRAKEQAHGLGLFVRSLVGLDREAATEALSGFIGGKTLSGNQLEFVNLVIQHLTEHGVMEAKLLYESPFTDLTPAGPEGLFNTAQVDELFSALAKVKASAEAA